MKIMFYIALALVLVGSTYIAPGIAYAEPYEWGPQDGEDLGIGGYSNSFWEFSNSDGRGLQVFADRWAEASFDTTMKPVDIEGANGGVVKTMDWTGGKIGMKFDYNSNGDYTVTPFQVYAEVKDDKGQVRDFTFDLSEFMYRNPYDPDDPSHDRIVLNQIDSAPSYVTQDGSQAQSHYGPNEYGRTFVKYFGPPPAPGYKMTVYLGIRDRFWPGQNDIMFYTKLEAVPEPATVASLLFGALGIALKKRFIKKEKR